MPETRLQTPVTLIEIVVFAAYLVLTAAAMRIGLGRALLVFAVLPSVAMAQVPANRAPADDTIPYITHRGDTLYGLAQKYLTSIKAVSEIQQRCKVKIPRSMPTGYRLELPRNLLRYTPITLRLVSFNGPVSAKFGVQALAISKGLELSEGAEISTGPGGFGLLTGSDGSRIALPSNTVVSIARARKYVLTGAGDIELAVAKGRAEIHAAKQVPYGEFRVRTPVATSAVRGTVFRAGFDPAAVLSATEVAEGNVAVASPRNELALPAGFGATANVTGDLAKEALLAPPALLDAGKVQTDEKVSFALKSVDAARGYQFVVSRDAGFEDVIAQAESSDPSADFADLKNGTFFLRAAAISKNGLHGLDEVWSFRRQRVGIAGDAGQTGLPGGIRINWHVEGEGKSLFRFQLFGDGDAALPLVDEAGLDKPGLTLTGLQRGAYRWRLGVIQTTAEGSAEVWTPLQKFTVSN